MDALRLPSYRKEFQKDDGLSRSLDSGSDPQWIEVCHPTGGGVVTWARTAAQTSNYGRTTLLWVLFEYIRSATPSMHFTRTPTRFDSSWAITIMASMGLKSYSAHSATTSCVEPLGVPFLRPAPGGRGCPFWNLVSRWFSVT